MSAGSVAARADGPALWSKLGSLIGLAFVVTLFALLRPQFHP